MSEFDALVLWWLSHVLGFVPYYAVLHIALCLLWGDESPVQEWLDRVKEARSDQG